MASALPQSPWHIERLRTGHDRRGFACGEPSLDDFLHRLAGQYDRRDLGRTYVAVPLGEKRVIGFYTLASGAVAFATVPETTRRKLPRHPLPVVHLGRLAVDRSAQGLRLGEGLLLDALHRCAQIAEEVGVHAVEVFALNELARQFYLHYGFTPLVDDPSHLYLPMKVIRQLRLA